MARPKKDKTLDRRVSVRLSDQTYDGYERIAASFDIPVGQLMRQILTLEVLELEELIAILQQRARGVPFAPYHGQVGASARERFLQASESGGFTERLRHQAAIHFHPTTPPRDPQTP